MRPLSEILTDLIGHAEEIINRPARFQGHDARFAALAAEVRRAESRPAEGVRTTFAAMAMLSSIEGFYAGYREATCPFLMLAGTALPLLRAEAWRARRNETEARAAS